MKQSPFPQNFAKQLNISFVPKVLRTSFTPENIPSKVKNSKIGLNHIFWGHPVVFYRNSHYVI